MSDLKALNRKEMQLEQIVNAIEGKDVEEVSNADTNYNKWLKRIAEAIENSGGGGAVKMIENMDSTNPVSLRDLASGVYVLHGYFKPCNAVSNVVMAQTPLYASVVYSANMSYIQLFYAVGNSIQYFEITDETFTLETVSLKQSTLKTNNKTIVGAINELYDLINSA